MNKKQNFPISQKIALLIVLILITICFESSLKAEFVTWDDDNHVISNLPIRSLSWTSLQQIFQSTINTTYIPLTVLSWAVEYHFFKLTPAVFHATNLILHLFVVIFFYHIARQLGLSFWGAVLASLLFGIHPMHVEAVAWISARKDVLYSVFYLLAVVFYLRPTTNDKRLGLQSLVFGLLAMLAKPMALSLPFILLLIDWFCEKKINRDAILNKIPYFLFIIPIGWMTYSEHMRNPIQNFGEATLIWIWTFSFYIQKFFWPTDLSPLYFLPKPVNLAEPSYAMALLIFVACVALLVRFRRNRWFVFAFGWYFLSMFFLFRFDEAKDLTIVADRFMYLPSLGFCLGFGISCERWWKSSIGFKAIRVMLLIILIGILGSSSYFTWRQCHIWQNSLTLWTQVINLFPSDIHHLKAAMAYNNRGLAQYNAGLPQKAISDFTKAIEADPTYHRAYSNRGGIYRELGQYDLAEKDFNQAIELNASNTAAYTNRGHLYFDKGKLEEAIHDLSKAIELDPQNYKAYYLRAEVYLEHGAYEQCLNDLEHAVKIPVADETWHSQMHELFQVEFAAAGVEDLYKKFRDSHFIPQLSE